MRTCPDYRCRTKTYRYRLTQPDQSKSYGFCKVCGESVDSVYYQVEQRKYYSLIRQNFSWTYHKCHSYFGHRDCLISKQRVDSNTLTRAEADKFRLKPKQLRMEI